MNIHWPLEIVARPVVDIDSNDLRRHVRELSADHAQFMAILDRDCSAVLIGGCDERLVEENLNLLRSKFSCDVQVEAPQVGYRETICKAVEVDHTYKRQSGGAGEFARVEIVVEPLEDKFEFEFENKVVGDAIPKKYIAGVEKGISVARSEGPIAGFPMVGMKVSLVDGAHHDLDSSALAFEIASRSAFREAVDKADSVLLQPILKIEAITPEEYSGGLMGELGSRRGTVLGTESEDDAFTISAYVPAAQMFGFASSLAQITHGRASFSVLFSHYERVHSPPSDDPLWPEPAAAALRA